MALNRKRLIALGALLLLSLLANLFVGGWWLGRAWHDGRHGDHGGPPGFQRFIGQAPDEARPILREVFARHDDALRQRFDAVREARHAVREALDAEPFSRAHLDEALATLRTRSSAVQDLMHTTLGDAAERLPPDARRQLGGQMMRRMP